MTVGVHRHAVVGHDHVHALAGGGDGGDVGADGGDAALQQRADHDRALGALRRVGMAALGAGDDAVGAHDHVAVEVDVHLQGGQDDVVQPVDKGALVEGIGVGPGGDAVVGGVDDVGHGVQVKGLGVHEHPHHAPVKQIAHGLGQTAHAEAHPDAPLLHDLGQGDGAGDGRAAHAGLVGEALLEVGGVHHHLGAVLRHHQLALVGGGLGRAGSDFFRNADGVHHAHIVHLGHGDMGGEVGEGDQAVRDGHDVLGLVAVDVGVAQHAAVGLAADAAQVAVVV